MIFSRDEYIDIVKFKKPQRQMFAELFGPLVGLPEEWKEQGATEAELNMTAFDWDSVNTARCGGQTGLLGKENSIVLEDTNEYTLFKDVLGRTTKLIKASATIPLPLDYPVTDMDGWLKLKPLYEFKENRIDWSQVAVAKKQRESGALIIASIPGGFDEPRQLMGEEFGCICYYDTPELMIDIIKTISDTAFKVLDRISEEVTIDCLCVHEDMAGKSGPLIGPSTFKEFITPYYLRIWKMLSSKGTQIFSADSDGYMDPILEAFIDSGVNSMHPMEPAAGVDMVKLKEKYGDKLSFKGGIDKFCLLKGKDEIRKELEYKMQSSMQEGGIIFGIDHRIPNGVALEDYRYYVNLGREILGIPPIKKNTPGGWARMAF